MWVKIKENITTDLWYKNHKGEIFEVYVAPWIGTDGEDVEPIYVVDTVIKNDVDILLISSNDVDVVEPRREKINKIKNKL